MVQLAPVDAQNPCQLYRVNLFTYAISSNYDLYVHTWDQIGSHKVPQVPLACAS